MTYSLVAREPTTGVLAVGVASHALGVGARVPHVRPGVGAVASQALSEPRHATSILATVAGGKSVGAALDAALRSDEWSAHRQIAVIDHQGQVAAATGARCMPASAQLDGRDASAQGNMLASDEVVVATLAAFVGDGQAVVSADALAACATVGARICDALEAGERAGGDLRGTRSAALIVAAPDGTALDVRVDDDDLPLVRLRELAGRATEHQRIAQARHAVVTGITGQDRRLIDLLVGVEQPSRRLEATFWQAMLALRRSEEHAAARLLVQHGAAWQRLAVHLVATSALPASAMGVIARIGESDDEGDRTA